MQAVAHPTKTFEPQHPLRLKDEIGPWAPVPIAWTSAVEELADARAWIVAHRLLEIAGRWVHRWRWAGSVRALADRVAASVVCSVRTFWSGWRRLKDAGLVEQHPDGWAIAARAGGQVCLVLAGERPSVASEDDAEAETVGDQDRDEVVPSEAVGETAAPPAAVVDKERVREIGVGSLVGSNQPTNVISSTTTGAAAAAPPPDRKPTTPEQPAQPDPWQGPAPSQAGSGVSSSRGRTELTAKSSKLRVFGHPVSSLKLEEMSDDEIASLPTNVIVELGKPRRIPGSGPARYEPNPWAGELIARLSGKSPERQQEIRLAKRQREREHYEAQKRINRKRNIVAGMRGDFPKRWKEFVDYVGRRWGAPAIDAKYLAARRIVLEASELDAKATDVVWHEAIGVLVQKPEIREPFAYFLAVLRKLVEEDLSKAAPGDAATPQRILAAPSLDLPADEYLRRWLDLEGGDK